jgi:hypothetical protein
MSSNMNEIYTHSLVKGRKKKQAPKEKTRTHVEHNTFDDSDDDKKPTGTLENMMIFPAISPIHHESSHIENAPSEKVEIL